ncbi:terminase large subunit [uncultured Roseobacter sp.]|uniref:terminase large subunit n=1 Tax=uncultured Roseobacter sp. TaxID=114847 RepID=UPI002625FF94|nr:terminase large subunit [uncultured Roseobacter sp.]
MSFARWDFSCPDWEERLKRGETPISNLPLDDVEASCAVDYYNKLRLPDVKGTPELRDVSGEWFRDIVRAAFGSVCLVPDPESPGGQMFERQVGELFILVPKKNSKTTNSAALGIVWLLMNTTPNVDGIIVGPTQEVADKCFDQAMNMIRLDPYLERRFKVIEHKKTIIDLEKDDATGKPRRANLKIKSFDRKVVTGSIPAFAIIDELHVMSQSHMASKVIAQIRGGMITNPESLLVFITTQSDGTPAGVFKEELDYARGVRDGRIATDVRMLPVLYEFPESVQVSEDKTWRDTKLWPMVLPNLNKSVRLDRLASEYRTASDKGLETEVVWASQHLNIQIGLGLHTDRWLGADYWLRSHDQALSFDRLLETSEVCVVGIDGGGLDDLLGFGVLGRHRETKVWQHWGRAWADRQVLGRRKSIAERLRDFEKQGDLVFCDNGIDDVAEIADLCSTLNEAGLLPEKNAIGLDPEGVAAIIDELIGVGITEDQLAAVSQGYKLNAAIKGTPRKLKNETLVHCGQPLMAWCVENAKTEMRGNAQVVTKQISGAGKIDPLMALFNAVQLMSWNPVCANQSYLANSELAVV